MDFQAHGAVGQKKLYLEELEVVEGLALDELVDLDVLQGKTSEQTETRMQGWTPSALRYWGIAWWKYYLGDLLLVKEVLQDLVVLDEVVLVLGIEHDLLHLDLTLHHEQLFQILDKKAWFRYREIFSWLAANQSKRCAAQGRGRCMIRVHCCSPAAVDALAWDAMDVVA